VGSEMCIRDRVNPGRLMEWVSQREGRARIIPPAKLELRFTGVDTMREALENGAAELERMLEPVVGSDGKTTS